MALDERVRPGPVLGEGFGGLVRAGEEPELLLVGVEGGVLDGDPLQLEAVPPLRLVVGDHELHLEDREGRDRLHLLGEDVVLLGHPVPVGLLGLVHEAVDEEGDDLAHMQVGHDGVVPLVPVEVALGLLKRVEPHGDPALVLYQLEQGLGVGILGRLLVALLLLVRREREPRADLQDGRGEPRLAHALELPGCAGDGGVAHAREGDALGGGEGREGLGGPGVLPVGDEGGGHLVWDRLAGFDLRSNSNAPWPFFLFFNLERALKYLKARPARP